MYDLQFDGEKWTFIENGGRGGSIRGPLQSIIGFMQHYHGFEVPEIDAALDEMIKMGHDGAQFGVLQSFLFTYKIKDRPIKIDGATHGVH